jgi:hypothetical protein
MKKCYICDRVNDKMLEYDGKVFCSNLCRHGHATAKLKKSNMKKNKLA